VDQSSEDRGRRSEVSVEISDLRVQVVQVFRFLIHGVGEGGGGGGRRAFRGFAMKGLVSPLFEDGGKFRIKAGKKLVRQFHRPKKPYEGVGSSREGGGRDGRGGQWGGRCGGGDGGRCGGTRGGRHGGGNGGRHGGRPSRNLISDAEYAREYFENIRRQALGAFNNGHARMKIAYMRDANGEHAERRQDPARMIPKAIIDASGRVCVETGTAKNVGLGLKQDVQEAAKAVEEEGAERLQGRKAERAEGRERRAEGRAERRRGRVSDGCAGGAGAGGSGGAGGS